MQDLQLDLAALAGGRRARTDQFAALALESGLLAFHGHDAAGLHQAFLEKVTQAVEFAIYQLDLAVLGGDLSGDALDLLANLADLLVELLDLAFDGCQPGAMKLFLAHQYLGNGGIGAAVFKFGRKGDLWQVVTRSFKARLLCQFFD